MPSSKSVTVVMMQDDTNRTDGSTQASVGGQVTLAILVDLLPITCMLCRYETVVAAPVQRMFYKVRARVVRGVKYSTWCSESFH